MIAKAAREAHQTEEAWVTQNLGPPEVPTDAMLKSIFEKVKPNLPPGTPFESLKDQLGAAAINESQHRKLQALAMDLKKKNNFTLKLSRPEPFRQKVNAKGATRGPEDAKITIVVFADFESPAPEIEPLLKAYPNRIRYVFRHFPLQFHHFATGAAKAAICAQAQGHFWEFHDALFSSTRDLEPAGLVAHAILLKLDEAQFNSCLSSKETATKLDDDISEGRALGIDGSPAFFVNGVMLSGPRSESDFTRLIDTEIERLEVH